MELNEVAQAMDVANAALEHLRARGPLSPQAAASVMLIEHGTAGLLNTDNEVLTFINTQRILLNAAKLAELSGAATLSTN